MLSFKQHNYIIGISEDLTVREQKRKLFGEQWKLMYEFEAFYAYISIKKKFKCVWIYELQNCECLSEFKIF